MPKVDYFSLGIKPQYTFDQLVVGVHNQMGAAACLEVVKAPGDKYNPLFIFGPAGVGKTHLMHAVAHSLLEKNPDLKVKYISAERFTSEVITGVAEDNVVAVRQHYNQLDLLLLDDVQFLMESKATQGEFFHVFNNMHQNNRQVIMAGDRPPNQLLGLDQAIRSRLEWGLAIDIKVPDVGTRVQILKMKQESHGISMSEEAMIYVAGILKSNVRELEGFLKRLNAYVTLSNQTMSTELLQQVIREVAPAGMDVVSASPMVLSASEQPPVVAQKPPKAGPSLQNAMQMNVGGASPNPAPVAPPPPPVATPTIHHPALTPLEEEIPVEKKAPHVIPLKKEPQPSAPAAPNSEHGRPNGLTPLPPEMAAPSPVAAKPNGAPKFIDPTPPPPPPMNVIPETPPEDPMDAAQEDPATAGLKEVSAVFFFPKGGTKELESVAKKFQEVIKKHKLKFRLKRVYSHEYDYKGKINYSSFVDVCKQNKVPVAIVIGPPPGGHMPEQDFYDLLSVTLDVQGVSLQLVNWTEIDKDYRYLNLSLDIALVRSR